MSATGTIIAPQFHAVSRKDRLAEVRKNRDQAQRDLDATIAVASAVNEKLLAERGARTARVRQSVEAISTLLMAKRKREATELACGEIRQLIKELRGVSEFADREWISWHILSFTAWRGLQLLGEVETAIECAFPQGIPNKIAEKLARLIEKQEQFLREQAKRNGIMRPDKTARERQNGSHARRNRLKLARAEEQRQNSHKHCKSG